MPARLFDSWEGTHRDMTGSVDTSGSTVRLLWAGRRYLAAAAAMGGIAFGAASFLLPTQYQSGGSFTLETPNIVGLLPRGLAGLASQLDLTGSQDLGGPSPWFFVSLATSDDFLRSLAVQPFGLERAFQGNRVASYLQRERISGTDSLDQLDKAVRQLRAAVNVRLDVRSNLISFTVETRDRLLSRNLATALFDSLNSFAVHKRQSKARNQRVFIQSRLQEAQDSLRTSEGALRSFYEANRTVATSPRLQLREKELQRDLQMNEDVFLTLSRENEEAQIAEVRDTPVLTLVDEPRVAPRKSSPHRKVLAAVGMILGLLLGGAVALRHRLVALLTSVENPV